MKRILFILLCFFFLTGSTIDTFEGQAVDTSSTIEGTDVADTIEGQTLASSAPSPLHHPPLFVGTSMTVPW